MSLERTGGTFCCGSAVRACGSASWRRQGAAALKYMPQRLWCGQSLASFFESSWSDHRLVAGPDMYWLWYRSYFGTSFVLNRVHIVCGRVKNEQPAQNSPHKCRDMWFVAEQQVHLLFIFAPSAGLMCLYFTDKSILCQRKKGRLSLSKLTPIFFEC